MVGGSYWILFLSYEAGIELEMSEIIQMQKQHFPFAFLVFSELVVPGVCVEVLETCLGGPRTLCHTTCVPGRLGSDRRTKLQKFR